jgi:uncharacterized protein (DUF362 family)
MNTRRDFIKTSLAAGATAAALPSLNLLASDSGEPAAPGKPDLVTVRGDDRSAMLDRALQAFGGIGAFVKKGQRVVIKPNIGWDRSPETGANTHPDIIGRLVSLCIEAGASRVTVFDNTCDKWERCYKNSGIEDAAKAAGARVVPGNDDSYYKTAAFPKGKKAVLEAISIHSAILESQVFINVPVLKHHSGSTMSACIKNLMGIIANEDRRAYHRSGLHQCIADTLHIVKPHLNILDAFSPMTRNGPKGRSVADLDTSVKQLLISPDIVAIDAAASRLLGHGEKAIDHVRIAAEAGYGCADLGKLKIERVRM